MTHRVRWFPACGALVRRAEHCISRTRLALAGAVTLALAHYAFGEWVVHPDVAVWRATAFWRAVPWVAAVPLINWVGWTGITLGRMNVASPVLLMFAALFVGDGVWLQVSQHGPLFGIRISRDFWYWWTYWLPMALVLGNGVIARRWWRQGRRRVAVRERRQLSWLQAGLRAAGVLVGAGVVLLALMRVVLPRMPVNDFTLDAASEFLVPAQRRGDFDYIVQSGPCRGRRLGALLDHVELANRQRYHFYKGLDAATFQQWILSPLVEWTPVTELDWRRPLWEAFYRGVRQETEPERAARTVVRLLRERVGISPAYPYRVGVETIWTQGMADEAGFERVYVAALRSVGIAARLGERGQTELLAGGSWRLAPRPLFAGW
jgi:hypothetical protein